MKRWAVILTTKAPTSVVDAEAAGGEGADHRDDHHQKANSERGAWGTITVAKRRKASGSRAIMPTSNGGGRRRGPWSTAAPRTAPPAPSARWRWSLPRTPAPLAPRRVRAAPRVSRDEPGRGDHQAERHQRGGAQIEPDEGRSRHRHRRQQEDVQAHCAEGARQTAGRKKRQVDVEAREEEERG